jgi:GH24 family phage-related lysozyme (muramidase)
VTDQPAPTGKATIIGGSAGMAIAIALLAQFQIKNEGLPPANPDGTRPVYKDPLLGWRVPTACWGDTGAHIRRGMNFTLDECMKMLTDRDRELADRVLTCLGDGVRLTPFQAIALFSLADNNGVRPVCTSTMVKLLRAGEPPIVWCSQFTEARSRFVPIQFPLAKDAKGNVLPMAQQPNAVSVPLHGWMVVGGRSCRDARAGCRGIVLRREREQAMCLGDVQAAMKF